MFFIICIIAEVGLGLGLILIQQYGKDGTIDIFVVSCHAELLKVCCVDCKGMDNQTVMAMQSFLESQNVQETVQGYIIFLIMITTTTTTQQQQQCCKCCHLSFLIASLSQQHPPLFTTVVQGKALQ